MNAESSSLEPVKWSARRWLYTIGSVFLVQLVLVVYLGEKRLPAPVKREFQTRILLATDPAAEQRIARLAAWSDPTLFALGSVHGFSGAAWLKFEPLNPQLPDWSDPPRWLEVDPDRMGQMLTQFAATNRSAPTRLADRSLSGSRGWEIYVSPQTIITQSTLRVEWPGAERGLLSEFQLPSWPHTDVLSNTVVQVLIDEAGNTISATPLQECGSRDADQYALKMAGQAQFSPVRKPERNGRLEERTNLDWARLTFRWHTLVSGATNRVSASSAP